MKKILSTIELLLDRINDSIAQSKVEDDRQFVTTLGRGLTLLSAFEYHEQLSHQQLCQLTTLPKATVTRLIHTLTTLEFLRMNAQGQYQLGRSSVRLSAKAWIRHDVVAFSEPLLRQFVTQNEVSVILSHRNRRGNALFGLLSKPCALICKLANGLGSASR